MIVAIHAGETKTYDFDNEDEDPKVVADKAMQAWLDATKEDDINGDDNTDDWDIKWHKSPDETQLIIWAAPYRGVWGVPIFKHQGEDVTLVVFAW